VRGAVGVGSVLPDVVDPHLDEATFHGPAEDALPNRPVEDAREQRQDVEAHVGPMVFGHHTSGEVSPGTSRTTTVRPATSTETTSSFKAGTSVSLPLSSTATHTSLACVRITSRSVPSGRPDSVRTSAPTRSCV